MKEWKIKVTPEAQEDIYDIHSYIANVLLAPSAAERQTRKILDAIRSLNIMPMRYPLYEKEPWNSRGLRKMVVDKFLVFYLTNEEIDEVAIFHVSYSGRDIDNFLKGK